MTDRARTIPAMVAAVAGYDPVATVLRAPGRALLGYAALAAQLDVTGKVLRGWGLRPGDRVVGQVPDGPEAAMACLVVSGVCAYAPLAPGLTAAEVATVLDALDPAVVLVTEDLTSRCVRGPGAGRHTARTAHAGRCARWNGHAGACPGRGRHAARGDDRTEVVLLMTSGRTSRSKLVPLSHRNLVASAYSIAQTLSLARADCCLNVMPVFHIQGLVAGVFASLAVGVSVSCEVSFDPQVVLSWWEDEEFTWYTVACNHFTRCPGAAVADWHMSIRWLKRVWTCASIEKNAIDGRGGRNSIARFKIVSWLVSSIPGMVATSHEPSISSRGAK